MRNLLLRAALVDMRADSDPSKRWKSNWLEVVDPSNCRSNDTSGLLSDRCEPEFWFMCDAIHSDIQNPDGSGATALEEIGRVESGQAESVEADGNAWVAHISRDKVWFEGLYSQGEGGEVSLAQYKLAVQTYVRFLSDPEHKPIEVPFPER